MIRHVYNNEVVVQGSEWHDRFNSDTTSLDDVTRSARPSSSSTPERVEPCRRLVHKDRRRSVNDIAAIVDVPYGRVQTILTSDLNIHRIAAEFGPRHRAPKSVKIFISVPWMTQPSCQGSPMGTRLGHDPETNQQSSQWKSLTAPCPKKTRQVRSAKRLRACSSFSSTFVGVFTVNSSPGPDRQRQVLLQCAEASEDIRRKGPELGSWMLYGDNVPFR